MKLKGIIDYDIVNYKEPTLTLLFNLCDFKCDKLNGCQVCQNSSLVDEPDIEVSLEKIWELYKQNPLTKGFCCQGLEPFDSPADLLQFISYIRDVKQCNDTIIIYTGYTKTELYFPFIYEIQVIRKYKNIIIKWGRYILNDEPHYDEILGIKLASNNQYAEWINNESTR